MVQVNSDVLSGMFTVFYTNATTMSFRIQPKLYITDADKCKSTNTVNISVINPDGQSSNVMSYPISKAAGCP
jgi:hypothetical protein